MEDSGNRATLQVALGSGGDSVSLVPTTAEAAVLLTHLGVLQ